MPRSDVSVAAIDLFVVPTLSFERLFAFLVLGHGRRQLWFEVTRTRRPSGLPERSPRPFPGHQLPPTWCGTTIVRTDMPSGRGYYNEVRTHLALGKDAPLGRAAQRTGVIVAIPISSRL